MPRTFYPSLADLVDASAIPGDFQVLEDLINDGLDVILQNIFYTDLVTQVSPNGVLRHYSLTLLIRQMKLPIVGTGMNLVFFRGPLEVVSEFPIVVDWRWEAYKYIARFEREGFSYLPDAFFDVLLELAGIQSRETFFDEIVRVFLDNGTPDYIDFIANISDAMGEYGTGHPGVENEIQNIQAQLAVVEAETTSLLRTAGLYSVGYIYTHREEFPALQAAAESVQNSLRTLEEEHNVTPNLLRDFTLAALTAVQDIDDKFDRLAELFKTWFGGITKQDFYDLLLPRFKVELNDINAALEFPREWLVPVEESPANSGNFVEHSDPDKVAFLEFNIGKLIFSTRKGFELKNQSQFSFDKAMIGKTGIILEFQNLRVDMSKAHNIPEADRDGRPTDFRGMFAETASVILPAKWFHDPDGTNAEIFGKDLLIGTGGLSGTIGLRGLGGDNQFKAKFGGEDGFSLGLKSFDIKFKQNKVLDSNINAALRIPKFVYPQGHPQAGQPVDIDLSGHIQDDGDFSLTAAVAPAFPIEFPDVFVYHMRTVELGEEDGKYFLGTSGKLEFQGFLKDTLKLDSIDVEKLRIYTDGSFEIEGGSINLIEPIVLPLGPVEITVTAIHYGSHQKEIGNRTRKFNYFGFDGGISVDPLGVEVRGDGVKFYFCTDDLPNTPSPYLHIQTLYLDLTIPASTPVAIINGWLSIPEPGVSPEYGGGVKIQVPQARIAGSADMKLAPRYPAFIVDASIDLPAPIPLGPIAMYGFRGLIGYRYVADREAIGLSSDSSWYDFYKKAPRGIHVSKFTGPDRTKTADKPFAIGAGATLGTSFDNGTVLNLKAMLLLSIPDFFMIDGRAAILSARLGLDSSTDPPFFAVITIDDESLELGFGADYKLPSKSGDIIKVFSEVQSEFHFNNASRWHIHFGTKENPTMATIIRIITNDSYLMLSSRGIEAGSGGSLDFKRKYGPIKVKAWGYYELGGKISFERPQFGAYMGAGLGADIDIKIVDAHASFDILFGVEAPKPFLIYGKFKFKIRIKILFVFSFRFNGYLEVVWDFNDEVNRSPVNPMLTEGSRTAVGDMVKGVNMLSNETFALHFLGDDIPNNLPNDIRRTILPLDTYIDIKSEKGFLPDAVEDIIGGRSVPPRKFTDLIPPEKIVKGKELRQVKHQYSIESIELKSWNPVAQDWENYHPWRALYPNDNRLANQKIGQFQISDGQYNTIRLLATNPLSYTEQGQRHWYKPEEYGLNPGWLFCEGERLVPKCANFLEKVIGYKYFSRDENYMYYSNRVAFLLLDNEETDFAEIVAEENPFGFAQSFAFKNVNRIQIRLPQPSVQVTLKLSSHSDMVRVHFFASLRRDELMEVAHGHPDPNAADLDAPFTMLLPQADLAQAIEYNRPDWQPVTRIEIVPVPPNAGAIQALRDEIDRITQRNNEIALGIIQGQQQDTEELEQRLEKLREDACTLGGQRPDPNTKVCDFLKTLVDVLPCFENEPQNTLDRKKDCAEDFLQHLQQFFIQNQDFQISPVLARLVQQMAAFFQQPTEAVAQNLHSIAQSIIDNIGVQGGCIDLPDKCHTSIHEICWMSLEDFQYNAHIPSQEAVEADVQSAILGMTGFIQPIWRPDTSYAVRFVLKDVVDDGGSDPGTFSYAFGFSTAGPAGYFHTHPDANYGDPDFPEQSGLTSITQYIDYQRSYPNADGNLLASKPLFYDDETTRIDLYFAKPWARHFFHSWNSFNGTPPASGRLKIVIKDPAEGSEIVNPPFLDYDENDTEHTTIPQSVENWQDDPNPQVPHEYQQYQALLDSQECILIGGQRIIPKSEFARVFPKHLKPRKLYTAIVNNLYDLDKDGGFEELNESREVHKFTFQTSRYPNFAAQVGSFFLSDEEGGTRPAVFNVGLALGQNEIAATLATIRGQANALADGIRLNYQHPFDRALEGLLGLPPLDAATGTEFNLIRNTNDANKIVAILIRNPEPFNNPRIPVEEVLDTIQVLNANGNAVSSFKYLHSKDYAQVLVMSNTRVITGTWSFRFRYKIWDGTSYVVPDEEEFSSDAVGTFTIPDLDLSDFPFPNS